MTPLLPAAGQPPSNTEWITAVVIIAVATAIALLLTRLFDRRGRQIAEAVTRGELTPQALTRLRFVGRLLCALIILIGLGIGLEEISVVRGIATSLLASSAIAAAAIGFAARQTLANVVAGVMLAITQPLRVGDWVEFEGSYGVVEDVALNYTRLRTPDDQRIVIPNEKLASGVLLNDTLVSDSISTSVSVWIPLEADADQAIKVLKDETGAKVITAEVTREGIRLLVIGPSGPPALRTVREGDLRRQCLRRLRSDRLLIAEPVN